MTNKEAVKILKGIFDWMKGDEIWTDAEFISIEMAIKALEQPNINDKLEDAYAHGYTKAESKYRKELDSLNKWIPCSVAMPKKTEKSYWVCLESGGQCQCRWTNNIYGLGSNEWSKWGWHIMDKPQYTTVIAWRELPEPYKGEEQRGE